MKHFNFSIFKLNNTYCLTLIATILFSFQVAVAQEAEIQKAHRMVVTNPNMQNLDDAALRKAYKENGISDAVIEKIIYSKRQLAEQGRKVISKEGTLSVVNPSPLATTTATCSQLGGETGWASWLAKKGDYADNLMGTTSSIIWGAAAVPAAARFNLTSGAGIDPCTPGVVAGSPTIPVVSPGFGNASLQIGQPQTDGNGGGCNIGCAEQITVPFAVTAADVNFIYSYAIILENPAGGIGAHKIFEAPYAEIYMLAANGDTVPCSHKKYMGDINGGIPTGMYLSPCQGSTDPNDVTYQPWTLVGVNLTNYVGQTITIVITNADCTQGGHYCYSYWDFTCDPLTNTNSSFCLGQSITLTAPSDPHFGYTYSWAPGGQTTQSITPTPAAGSTYTVLISQPSGCNFKVPYAPTPNGAVANYTFSTSCGGVTSFTDSSYIPLGIGTISSYSWTFPGGTPATANTPTASVTFPPGTYSVTLNVTSSTGCTSTIIKTVNTTGMPLAAFSSTTVCVGDSTHLTDHTVAVTGDPFVSWSWTIPGGSPATSTLVNPATLFTAGTHSVTLVVTTQHGCHNTITLPVTINALPQPSFTSPPVCVGNATPFTNNSTSSPGDPIATSNWTFPGGTPATSNATSPTVTFPIGTYTVSLVTTTTAGCKDSTKMPVTVNAMPVAAFTSNTICAGNVTSLTDGSTAPVGQALTWSWTIPGGTPSTSTSQNPSVSFPTSGTYSVALTVTTPFGCTNTVIEPVMVNASPQAVFSSSTVCAGNVTSLTDASTPPPTGGAISGWSWTFANGNPATSTSQNPTVTFPAGTYNATVTVTAQNGCTNTVVHPVLVHGLPIAAFTFNAPCLGNPTNLNNTSSSAGNDPITSWSWNMTGGVPATSATQTATTTYSAPGTHTVTLTVITQGGCKDTISDTVRVHAPPVANFSGSGTGCLPLCVTNYTDLSLSTDGNIINSTWSFPGGSPSSSTVMNPPKVCYSAAGTYGASLVVTTSFGCIDSIKITPLVSVFAWPHADFCLSPDQAPATDPVFNFCPLWSPNPGVTSWVWDFGDGSPKDSGNSANNLNMTPVHSYSATATANDFYTFNICLKVKNQNGCWDSVCKTVELIPEFEFYISNSFTPNGDGTNDLFFGKGRGIKDYNIWVFDRWGNNIWDCSYSGKNTDWDNTNQDGMPSACKWDGAVVKGGMDMSGGSGNVVQQDVYVWKVKLTDVFDKNHTYVGRVSVIK